MKGGRAPEGAEPAPLRLVVGADTGAADPAELSVRIVQPLLRYLDEVYSTDTGDQVVASAGLAREVLATGSGWISHERYEAFLAAARAQLGDDDEFALAASYRYSDLAYGPLRFVLWATTPWAVYELGRRNIRLISAISTIENERIAPNEFVHSYRSLRPESALSSRLRRSQTAAMPTLWGLPPAQIEVEASIWVDGEDRWRVRFYEPQRWVPTLLGGIVGLGLAPLLMMVWQSLPTIAVLPVLGGAIGTILELRRVNRVNLRMGQESTVALRDLARQDAEARRELIDLHRRQREWSRLLEEQVSERTARLERMVEHIQDMSAERASSLRGFSHDLRNPLTYLMMAQAQLEDLLPDRDESRELLGHHRQAVDRMERLLSELMEAAVGDAGEGRLVVQKIVVDELVDAARRRLQALVYGRPIRVSVLGTRERPDAVHIDELVLDRILDNVLTNAAKYTERGSIVVEFDGQPGFLIIKVSDSGRGIEPDAIRSIFEPGASRARAPRSYGLGLSVVVRLLDEIGGRLEVMSKAGIGTTFWVFLPARELDSEAPRAAAVGNADGAVDRVVTIRPTGTNLGARRE